MLVEHEPGCRGRRRALKWLAAASVTAVVGAPSLALAGSYLDRVGLLVRQGRSEIDYLEYRLGDKDLAELIHKLATARLAASRDMLIPKEVVQAHPHMLLMLENCERAADAAEAGERLRFITFQRRGRDEEQMFRSIMRQLGFPLEDEKRK
ncbi:MAG TPA: hypothetical protein VHU80_04055 [Polyangiaceae bacterium]|jgi:hypothetical protein|nr:hypothetical protein [Polyangiaceae bacterium]